MHHVYNINPKHFVTYYYIGAITIARTTSKARPLFIMQNIKTHMTQNSPIVTAQLNLNSTQLNSSWSDYIIKKEDDLNKYYLLTQPERRP